jgi:hypothetical protein
MSEMGEISKKSETNTMSEMRKMSKTCETRVSETIHTSHPDKQN